MLSTVTSIVVENGVFSKNELTKIGKVYVKILTKSRHRVGIIIRRYKLLLKRYYLFWYFLGLAGTVLDILS